MSTIFSETMEPLPDATIRVLHVKRIMAEKTSVYITADLLEFHPNLKERQRLIFRSYAMSNHVQSCSCPNTPTSINSVGMAIRQSHTCELMNSIFMTKICGKCLLGVRCAS